MTIYTIKAVDKKEDFISPEVVDYEYMPVAKQVSVDNVMVQRRRSRMGGLHICFVLILLPLALCLLTGCIWLYKRLNHHQASSMPLNIPQKWNGFHGNYGLNFYQLARPNVPVVRNGHFEWSVEFTPHYELIHFPAFLNFSQSKTLHVFDKNLTLIVDGKHRLCYYMPMKRSRVLKTHSVWKTLKLIKNLKAELKVENYNMVEPKISKGMKMKLGEEIMKFCADFDTYQLVPHNTTTNTSEEISNSKEFYHRFSFRNNRFKNLHHNKLKSHNDTFNKHNNKLNNNNKHNKKHNNKLNNNINNIPSNSEYYFLRFPVHNNKRNNNNKRNKKVVKRAVCRTKGLQYCESATQQHHLYCFNIANCV